MRSIGYFASWSIYGRNYFPKDLPLNLLTHVTLSFALPEASGQMNVEELKKINFVTEGKVKLGVAIGGWGTADSFSLALRNHSGVFIESCLRLISEFNLDYLEFDWEYPKSVVETLMLKDLLLELKARLPAGIELSVCLPCFQNEFMSRELVDVVDFFVLMAYDLSGPWSQLSGHHSVLFPTISERCHYLMSEEMIPSEKIVLGCPLYARTFSGCNGPNQRFTGPGMGSFGEQGSMDYKDCVKNFDQILYDSESVSCYSLKEGEFVSYDGPESIRRKCRWSIDNSLGGLAFWHVAADASGCDSLIQIASNEFKTNI